MSQRFELHRSFKIIARLFGLTEGVPAVPTGYNIAPGRDIAIIVNDTGTNRLANPRLT